MISVICSTINPNLATLASIESVLRDISSYDELILHLDPCNGAESSWDPKISDSRLTILRTTSRIGFANGLNLAASRARHEFLGRIDADDLSLPGRWAYQLKAITDVDVHFGSMLHYYPSKFVPLILPHYPVALAPQEFQVVARFTNPGFHPAALMRRSSFEKLGGYRDVISEDYDLWLRGLAEGMRFSRGLRPVTLYRHHAQQATSAKDWADRVSSDASTIRGQTRVSEILSDESVSVSKVLWELSRKYPFALLEFRHLFGS